MPEANHRPSLETRQLMARAWSQARRARNAVNKFSIATRLAILAFDIDANAWAPLSDADYEAFEKAAGLRRVLDAADRMAGTLGSLNEDRAA